MTSPGRPARYGGKTADERRSERRARLVEAGSQLWLDQGWAAVSMRAVCARAGLVDRYFYESFQNTDDLLASIWDDKQAESIRWLLDDIATRSHEEPRQQLRAGITAFVCYLADHPDEARILYGSHAGCAALEYRQRQTRRDSVKLLVDLAEPWLTPTADREDFAVLVRMALGGLIELIAAWQVGDVAGDVDGIVDLATRYGDLVATAVLGRSLGDAVQ